jgi:protein-disulfide isomerase-like protein with CxxC motif
MSSLDFSITWDYRCPFARIASQHVVAGLRAGADWSVTFVPFSQSQSHVEHGDPDVWDNPDDDSGLLALRAAVTVRDHQPEHFLDVHEALFEARHGDGRHIRDPDVVRDVLAGAGADADAVFSAIAGGEPLDTVRKEHEQAARDHEVWGVPTFIAGDRAAFVRLMEGPRDDIDAVASVERIVGMLDQWSTLNEFKHTSLAR